MTTAAQLMVKVGADVGQALSGLRQVDQSIGNLAQSAGSKLQNVGHNMMGVGAKATAMALPVTAAMGVAIKTAADFETQMNILNITMRESGVTGETWSRVALKIGADSELVGISASEAADAITNFGKAGLDTTQILGDMSGYLEGNTSLTGALRAAIDLAAASELDLNEASMSVVTTMNQYGLSFDDASRVLDNFVRTADASTASVGDLLEAQKNVGPVMAQMGFSVEHANIMLAMLADRGIAGAEAGTALKSMFMNMTNPATKAGDALATLGVKLYDASGTMRSAQEIVADLSKALDENAKMTLVSGGATEEQAKALLKAKSAYERIGRSIYEYENGLKGVNLTEAARSKKLEELRQQQEAYRGEIDKLTSSIPGMTKALVDMTDAQRNAYLQQIAGSYGIKALNILVDEGAIGWDEYETAIAGATSMQEQAAARTEGFHAAMEQFKSVVETFMITAATPFIKEFLTPFLRKAGDFLQKLMDVHPEFAKWAMVIGGVIVVAGPLLMFIGSMITALGTIISVVGGVIGIFTGLGGAIMGLVAAVATAGAPILLVIGAIIGIIYLLKAAWDSNFLGIADALREFWAEVERAFGYVKAIITSFVEFVKGEITWDEFLARASYAFQRIGEIITDAFEALKVRLAEVWDRLKALIVEKLAEFIAPLVGGMENAREIVTTAFERIQTFLSETWDAIKTAAEGAWEYLKGVIAGAVEVIRGVLAVVLQIISGDWEGAWNTIKETVTRVWDEIKAGIQNALDVIAPAIKTAWEGIKTAVSEKVEAIKTAVTEKWEAIKTAVSEKVEDIKTAALEKWEGIKTGVTEKVDALKTSVGEKWEALRTNTSEKWDAVKTKIEEIVGGIKTFVTETLGGLVDKAIELFGKIIGAITGGGGKDGGESPFKIDFAALIASLLNLREEWTTTQTHIAGVVTAIHENVTATWYLLRDALLVIWAEVQAAYTTWGMTMVTVTGSTWTAVFETTTATWYMIRDELLVIWLELRETYIRRMLDILAATRQHNQWILQENERTWPKIIDEIVRALLTMKAQALAVLTEFAAAVKNALDSVVTSARASGIALGDAFAAGIYASIPAIEAAAQAAAAAARAYLPSSDAKRGPLSDLSETGPAFIRTFADGIWRARSELDGTIDRVMAITKRLHGPSSEGGYDPSSEIKPPPHMTRPFEKVKPYLDEWQLPVNIGGYDPSKEIKPPAHATRPFEPVKPGTPYEPWTDPIKPPPFTTRPFEKVKPYLDEMMLPIIGMVEKVTHATRPFEKAKPGTDWFNMNRPSDYAYTMPVEKPDFSTSNFPGIGGMGGKPQDDCCTTIHITINNPTGQPSEASIMQALKQLAAVGVLHPVTAG